MIVVPCLFHEVVPVRRMVRKLIQIACSPAYSSHILHFRSTYTVASLKQVLGNTSQPFRKGSAPSQPHARPPDGYKLVARAGVLLSWTCRKIQNRGIQCPHLALIIMSTPQRLRVGCKAPLPRQPLILRRHRQRLYPVSICPLSFPTVIRRLSAL